jgi:two-component system phosphate regulon sensor histidine kinase PhoR
MPKKVKTKKEFETDFVNLTSHQLRTPLSGTKWLLELLQKKETGKLNVKQKDFVEKIYSSNERMIALVNDLLEVLRIEEGQIKLYLQSTDIAAIIHSIIRQKSDEIKKKHLTINFTIENEPFPEAWTETNKIKQAILNIIANGISYTEPGGKILVDLKVIKGEIVCTVTDTGVGIPKAQQKKVFTKFFRGSNITGMETAGTGLGLFIAKAFIEASRGKIGFKSTLGKGTSFYFTLPISK